MSLADLALLYLVIGLACAVAIYRVGAERGPKAIATAAIAVPLWPLWAPVALTSARPDRPRAWAARPSAERAVREAAARIDDALREADDEIEQREVGEAHRASPSRGAARS